MNSLAADFGQIPMSPVLAATLARASDGAGATNATEVSLEHILAALCDDPDAVAVLDASGVNIGRLQAVAVGYLSSAPPTAQIGHGGLVVSADARRILEAAAAAARGGRRRDINGAIVLAAIVGDGRSIAAQMLQAEGLTFDEAIKALQAALSAPAPRETAAAEDVLARARERVQSRATPTLRDIMNDLPRAVPPPPMPSSGPSYPPASEPPAQALPSPAGPDDLEQRDLPINADGLRPESTPEPAPASASSTASDEPHQQDFPVAPEPSAPRMPMQPAPSSPQQRREPGGLPVGGAPPSGYAFPAPPPPFGPPSAGSGLPPPGHGRSRPQAIRPPPIPMPPGQGAGPGSFGAGALPTPMTVPGPPMAQRGQASGPGFSAPHPNMRIGHAPQPAPMARSQNAPQSIKPSLAAPKRDAAGKVETGQLAENIPRAMRVATTARVEIRIAKGSLKALSEGLDGGGVAWRHDVAVTQAMSVRLRAPEGGFFIETVSPETQWIENQLGFPSDEFASWRFLVTPQSRGWSRLQIIVSARTIGPDGMAAETALPDQVVEVKVRTNFKRMLSRAFGWIVAAVAGGALARFGETGLDLAQTYVQKFMH